jgi:DNA-binding phage protein
LEAKRKDKSVSTFYEKYRDERLADREFKQLYERHRSEIDAIDTILSAIEHRREELEITKADLARLTGKKPESVRRLLSGRASNPTLITVLEMTEALGMKISVKSAVPKKRLAPAVKEVARELKAASA